MSDEDLWEHGVDDTIRKEIKFIDLIAHLCERYHWAHDFWRRMGRREFYAFVEQANEADRRREGKNDTWSATQNDPGWQAMRAKRDKLRGR